ncbi:MAG: aminoacetone oxidase family FAD-binding enzyme [Oscillospiraceae bacterium]|nr:aminoacetone oxidase family FAD-binding enzyme [Oscillospiraceae bacterium]
MADVAEIFVVGGGASGMAAAITASQTLQKQKQPGRVLLLEKEPRIGKKLLATGNGRCNLSNLAAGPSHYHNGGSWASPLLRDYPAKAVIRAFEQMGLLCRSDGEGRVYPYNLQSSAVLEILRLQLQRNGVQVVCDCPVTAMQKKGAVFQLTTPKGNWFSRRVILSTGGRAAPKLGSDGSGAALAKTLGHTICPQFPALSPLCCDGAASLGLKGMRSQAVVSLLDNGNVCQTEQGEVQFTDYGLSGICVFQLSGQALELLNKGHSVTLSLDLMTEWKQEQLTKKIAGQGKRYPELPTLSLLCGFINQKVGQAVVKQALGKQIPQKAGDCRYDQYEQISKTVKAFRFSVTGSPGWDSAQVTAGGVDCKEVDGTTMASRRCRGLYLTGELLSLYGDCGGFNLHLAWSSGMAAGQACAQSLKEEKR